MALGPVSLLFCLNISRWNVRSRRTRRRWLAFSMLFDVSQHDPVATAVPPRNLNGTNATSSMRGSSIHLTSREGENWGSQFQAHFDKHVDTRRCLVEATLVTVPALSLVPIVIPVPSDILPPVAAVVTGVSKYRNVMGNLPRTSR